MPGSRTVSARNLIAAGCALFILFFDVGRLGDIMETIEASISSKEAVQVEDQNDPNVTDSRSGFCSLLPPGVMASNLWSQNVDRLAQLAGHNIYTAGHHPEWIHELIKFMSPRFLRLGYNAPPLPETLDAVLDIVYKRIQDPDSNPPLKIAVFGGSVTQGRGSCVDAFGDTKKEHFPATGTYKCHWVGRMQVYADEFLGQNVVQVSNLASGGTTSALALPTIQFKLYGDGSSLLPKGPDVIINSYTTNDALIRNHNVDITNDTEWQSKKRDLHKEIITRATQSRPCSKLPLVAYFSDYIGNQHDRIIGEQTNNGIIQELSSWYHTAFASYASAVGRLVYANSKEHVFSAVWQDKKGKTITDVHFGLQGHLTASWVFAFAALQAVVDHCDDDYVSKASPFSDQHPGAVMDLVERVLPPELNRDTRLSTVSEQWRTEKERTEKTNQELCNGNEPGESCSLAFVANPVGTVRNGGQMAKYLKPRTSNNNGWEIKTDISQGGWSFKLGWVAKKPDATATLFVDNLNTEIRFIRIFYLKSYGEIWEGSTLKGTVRSMGANETQVVDEFILEGFWEDKETRFSMSTPFVRKLKTPVPAGNRVELQLDLVGGSSFKITSIMMCRD